MAYTVRDTPAVVARIDRDLATAVATVREGDPNLRALVLTGGFARGEGAVLHGAPQNDYDLVALRGVGRPRRPYAAMRAELERQLGLHIDLAPVQTWRLAWAKPSILWYETALQGRVLWGADGPRLLGRIRCRTPQAIGRGEGLRLLANRAAGLLLTTTGLFDARIQASKALLAAVDARLLASGSFAPTQRARWAQFAVQNATSHRAVRDTWEWFAWGFHYKVDPATAPPRLAVEAWQAARLALLDAIPVALRHAGLDSLEQAACQDGLVDRVVFARRSAAIPGARRWAAHPTARVRAGTLRLLEASPNFKVDAAAAGRCLRGLAAPTDDPVRLLDLLRQATLQ